jgi:transcriptional regulator with XRE-family HTH domain
MTCKSFGFIKEHVHMTLPEKIKHLRKERGWSQTELADHIGIHTGHVSRLETGRYQPSVELLRKLAQVLEVTTDYLLSETDALTPVTVEDKDLTERVRLIEALDEEERNAVLRIIDGLLTKKKLFDVMKNELRHTA